MEGQGENDELYPIAVLIDELKVRCPMVLYCGILSWTSLMLESVLLSTMMFSSVLMLSTVSLPLPWL